ncbi:MAG: Y-family DNA polymerase [Kiritimatiellae bacterium]|nr:Y-family DNA polymerase [Kiritimatiellia bacterium]
MTGLVDGNNFFVSCERVFNRSLVGRPVAVLSNNDGCCVSRSNEFKALGIPMGTPRFQLKDRERSGELSLLSSNYELYGDMSRRIMSILRSEAVDVEQYSIDEAFITPPASGRQALCDYGARIRAKILRWTGIPCGLGFAPTKTLAKIANHMAKKSPDGVFMLPDDATAVLASLPVGEVWGVGRRLPAKLRAEKIFTALDLRDAPSDILLRTGGIALVRTALELQGKSSGPGRDYDADPDSVSCSRSFSTPATTRQEIEESITAFTSQAAAKLRRHGLLASGANIYAQIFRSGGGGDAIGRTVMFPAPTDATSKMLQAFKDEMPALFRPGTRYRKTGVVFFGLEKPGSVRQTDLFSEKPAGKASPLYKAIDLLNAKYGRGKVFSAAEGIGARSWHMKRILLSRRCTTAWSELAVAR